MQKIERDILLTKIPKRLHVNTLHQNHYDYVVCDPCYYALMSCHKDSVYASSTFVSAVIYFVV